MKAVVDALDIFAAIMAVVAVVFLFVIFPTASNPPELLQLGIFSLMLAVVPYCIAGAFHRIYTRR